VSKTGRQAGRQAGRKELRVRGETAGLDARAATPERVAVYRGCWPSVPARRERERERERERDRKRERGEQRRENVHRERKNPAGAELAAGHRR